MSLTKTSRWQQVVLARLAWAALCIFPILAGAEQLPSLADDPIPLLRVLIPLDRLPAELDRVRSGTLVQLSREQFEARVQRAALANESLKNPPQLVEARYRAALANDALVGSGQWKVVNSAATGSTLRFPSFNLAWQKAKWEKPQFGTTEAILTSLDPKTSGLLVDQQGQQSLLFDWSSRGDPRPNGLHVGLQVPSCAVASLELELPANQTVAVASEGLLLSGPKPANKPGQNLWRIDFSGRSEVDLVIQSGNESLLPLPLLLARLETHQELSLDLVQADFEFNIEITKNGLGELRFLCDPSLRPYEVLARNLEKWDYHAAPASGPGSLVVVRLREPLQTGAITVRCQASLPENHIWTYPKVRLEGALLRGESLTLRVAPEVKIENWQPGNLRLTRSLVESNGWQVLNLAGSGLASAPGIEKPSARLKLRSADLHTRQLLSWRIQPSTSSLTAQVIYDVAYGQVFQLPLLLPADWLVDRVELTPADLLRNWAVVQSKTGSQLIVDLRKSLGPQSPDARSAPSAKLLVRLKPAKPLPSSTSPNKLTFPRLLPLNTSRDESSLAISLDPVFQAEVTASTSSVTPQDNGPWGRQTPDYFFRSQGQPIDGSLLLRMRKGHIRARCTTEVVLASGRCAVVVRLLLQPDVGTPEAIDFHISAPVLGKWKWKVKRGFNGVRAFEHLNGDQIPPNLVVLGARSSLEVVGFLAAQSAPHQQYRLILTQPLREPLLLEATLDWTGENFESQFSATDSKIGPDLDGSGINKQWEVPLLTVSAADPMDGEVHIHLAGTGLIQAMIEGLREAPVLSGTDGPTAWRSFHYAHAPARLTLLEKTPRSDRSNEAVVESTQLTSYVEPQGRLLHHFVFQVRNWRLHSLPLWLPPHSLLLGVKIAGSWSSQINPQSAADSSVLVTMPVPVEKQLQRFELVYAVPTPPWQLWTSLVPSENSDKEGSPSAGWEPKLPIQVMVARRTLCLPPGTVPLFQEQFQPMPSDRDEGWWHKLLPHWMIRPLPLPSTAFGPDRESPGDQLNRLREQVASIKKKWRVGEAHGTLAEFLERLQLEHESNQQPLVLDTKALEDEGLFSTTPLVDRNGPQGVSSEEGANTVECFGLVFVPARSAMVLTTHNQFERWPNNRKRIAVPESIEAAVTQASLHEHDPSCRFLNLIDWLDNGDAGPRNVMQPTVRQILPPSFDSDWVEWQPNAGIEPDNRLIIVSREAIFVAGLLMAVTFILGSRYLSRAPKRTYLLFLFGWLVLGWIGWLWLPVSLKPLAWSPAITSAVLVLVKYLRWATSTGRSISARAASVLVPSVAFAILAGVTSSRAAPVPATVFLVPGSPDGTAKETVLVSPDLLSQLDTLALNHLSANAVLLNARYEGSIVDNVVDFTAEYRVHCLTDEPNKVPLGLEGVQLKEALIDGAAGQPIILQGPAAGYLFTVRGKGEHSIILRFTALAMTSQGTSDLRFTIPEVTQSSLILAAPPGVQDLHIVACKGASSTEPSLPKGGTSGPNKIQLQAALGRLNALHARWRSEPGLAQPVPLFLQEAYLWDLRPSATSLFGVLQYTIGKGTVTSLMLDLPEEVEVRSLEVSRLRDQIDESGPRLRQWQITPQNGHRRMQLDFQQPVSGSVQIMIELVPHQPSGAVADLRLPVPLGVQQNEQPGKETMVAYRVDGWRAQVAGHLRITGIERQSFADFWRGAGMGEIGPDTHAFTFRRTPAGPPVLRLNLKQASLQIRGNQNVTWTVGRNQAQWQCTARLSAPEDALALIEWEIPAEVILAEVSGAEVWNWSRDGSRVQVWLRRSTGSVVLNLNGWLPLLSPNAPDPQGKKKPGHSALTFRLLPLRLIGKTQTTYIRVRPTADLALDLLHVKNLMPLPDNRLSDPEFALVGEQADYEGVFQARPINAVPEGRMLSFAEVIDRSIAFTALLDCNVRQGELRTFTLQLRNWEGDNIKLEAPDLIRRQETQRGARRVWTLVLRPGYSGRYRLKLVGLLPLPKTGEVLMPELFAQGINVVQRWIAVAGKELPVVPVSSGLVPVKDVVASLHAWPAEAERIRRAGSLWEIRNPEWQLRLRPRSATNGSPLVKVLLSEQRATVAEGSHWVHQSTDWLYHEVGSELTVKLPEHSIVMSVVMDGTSITPLQPTHDQLWLPFAGSPGFRRVSITWKYDGQGETLKVPRLDRPVFPGAARAPVIWVIHIPDQFKAKNDKWTADQVSAASHDLLRAQALLELSALLADPIETETGEILRSKLLATQEKFYRYCFFAANRPATDERVIATLNGLKVRNSELARLRNFESIRAEAEKHQFRPLGWAGLEGSILLTSAPAEEGVASFPEWGVPLYLQRANPGAVPGIELQALQSETNVRSAGITLLFLLSVSLIGFLSSVPSCLLWARFFWAEQMVLLGCLAVYGFGPNWLALGLVLVGLGGRLIFLTARIVSILKRARTPPAAENPGVA